MLFITNTDKHNNSYYISTNGGNYTNFTKEKIDYTNLVGLSNSSDSSVGHTVSIFYFFAEQYTALFGLSYTSYVYEYILTKFVLADTSVSFYSESQTLADTTESYKRDGRSARSQYNEQGATYYYVVFG